MISGRVSAFPVMAGRPLPRFAGERPATPLPSAGKPYEASFLKSLFDTMEPSYERIGDICSLGFSRLWRKSAVKLLDLKPGETVSDMMAGTGEAWGYILPKIGPTGKLTSIDFSSQMTHHAQARQQALKADNVTVLEADATATPLASNSQDAVFSAYGVKTLSNETAEKFVAEIHRVLKPGGRFSLVEVSMPENAWHRPVFHAFLSVGFPVLKKMMGEKAQKFEMFYYYLNQFQNCKALKKVFEAKGFDVRYVRMLGDGATALVGAKKAVVA